MSETPDELRAQPLSAEAKAELRRWVPRYEHRAMTSGDETLALLDETLALLDEIDALLARLATAEADAEAGWKWAWSFDQWTEHGATGSLTDEARAEFQRDLAAHENREQP